MSERDVAVVHARVHVIKRFTSCSEWEGHGQGRRRDVETEEGGVDPGGKLDPIECEKGDRRKAFRMIEN